MRRPSFQANSTPPRPVQLADVSWAGRAWLAALEPGPAPLRGFGGKPRMLVCVEGAAQAPLVQGVAGLSGLGRKSPCLRRHLASEGAVRGVSVGCSGPTLASFSATPPPPRGTGFQSAPSSQRPTALVTHSRTGLQGPQPNGAWRR